MTPLQHLNLLLRFDRTFNLRHVIHEYVKEGDAVLDAGCGLGILSQWAMAAGASHVDAVDLSDLTLSAELAEANGCGNSIDFHKQDLSAFMEDPERQGKYDCLFAMIYLNDPRRDRAQSELALELKRRLLKPDGRLVPERVEYSVAVCDWPEQDFYTRQHILQDRVREIESRYGLNFDPLTENLFNTTYKEYFPDRSPDGTMDLSGCQTLCRETPAFTVDYVNEKIDYPDRIELKLEQSGRANSVIFWQKLMVNDLLIFSNQTVGWIDNPTTVQSGENVSLLLDEQWLDKNRITLVK